MNPQCSFYVETVEGDRFGPHSTSAYLNENWEILATAKWKNTTKETKHISWVIMFCPIGMSRFSGDNTKVISGQEMTAKMKITSKLPEDDEQLKQMYLRDEIDFEEFEYRMFNGEP